MKNRVLITGGAGFIGSNIAHALVRRGFKVRIFDNLSTGNLDNLRGILDRVEFLKGDLRDMNAVREAVKGVRLSFTRPPFHRSPDRSKIP